MSKTFFPQKPNVKPMIYAYEDSNTQYKGCLKIGYTTIDVEKRVRQQYSTLRPNGTKPYNIVFAKSAMYTDGGNFMDHHIHKYLDKKGFKNVGGEWYKCNVNDVMSAWIAVRSHTKNEENRTLNFAMRPEQDEAINKIMLYFESVYKDNKHNIPKFLLNCKMRFGKSFASYQLAKKMKMTRVLIITFKPAVQSAWEDDLKQHIDFEGWQFVSHDGLKYEDANKSKPIVCFGSFQDYLGINKETGGIKAKNEWVHTINWDLVIFDEYHFGAWKDNAKKLFEILDNEKEDIDTSDHNELIDETWLPITTKYYLYLSGTPFRAINSGEFIEEQVYNWTYSDEQRAKENWKGPDNPYESLPRMVMMTYEIPEAIRRVALGGEFNEFDLNMFFEAKGKGREAHFVFENEVQNWLDLIRGAYLDTSIDELKVGIKRGQSYLPFKETALLNVLSHTLWFLPNVSSCDAMENLLKQRQNNFYHTYKVNNCSGTKAGVGLDALYPVLDSMDNPLESKTITLTCGKLCTGVTVKPWSGIFMLRNLSTPETYFQSAFRVQSPWEVKTETGKKEIIKKECYVFDFALDRALKQIADYATKLDINEPNPEKKVRDFIDFLPVLAYKDGAMKEIDAAEILDISMSGTTATFLARKWESALLVNVDNTTLQRLLNNERAMEVLMKIEGFRSLNKDISTIIAKSDDVKNKKKEIENPTPKEKKQISEEEKEFKSKRKEIQEKLIKFATRVPVFMYLTDYREYSLEDVITKLESTLFKKVTGLDVDDFNLLISLGIFNKPLMNDAIYKFKRYEDSSLEYTGINKHEGEKVGLFDTVLTNDDYLHLYKLQQKSLAGKKQIYKSKEIVSKIKKAVSSETQTKKVPKQPTKIEITPVVSKPTRLTNQTTFVVKKKIINIDKSKIVVSAKVSHKAFGIGFIVSLSSGIVEVKFNDYPANKNFKNPQCFENGFLKLED